MFGFLNMSGIAKIDVEKLAPVLNHCIVYFCGTQGLGTRPLLASHTCLNNGNSAIMAGNSVRNISTISVLELLAFAIKIVITAMVNMYAIQFFKC